MPEAIVQCARLNELYLSSNRIKQLPLYLGKCVSLRILDLQSNVIAEIPANLACLVNLKRIYLGKNCLLYTSPSPRDGLLSRMPSSA